MIDVRSSVVVSEEPEISDEALVERIRGRDAAALECLYDRHARQAFAVAWRMVGSREVAEEVTQDAFLSVWRQAATYNVGAGRVRPWLMSIVHHRAIDRLRRVRERRPTAQLDEAWMKAADCDVFGEVYRNVQREEIRAALARLPDEQRRAVELAYFSASSFVEIAEITGVPVGTVKSRVRLALAKLEALVPREIAT